MKEKNVKVSLFFNILIVLMTVFACVVMFGGFKFMNGYEPVLESSKLGMFRFFTVQSNILMSVSALIFAIKEIELLNGDIKNISTRIYCLKYVATVSVSLTFLVVFAYLGNIAEYGLLSLLMNSNLFFHLFIPVVSIITFIFFEKNNVIKFKYTLYGLLPTFLYSLYYLTNVLVHMENNKVSPEYDWYYFAQNGIKSIVIVVPLMLIVTYGICLVLWKFNIKRKHS